MPPYPRSHASLWITLAPVMPPMLPIASPELPLCAACVEYLSGGWVPFTGAVRVPFAMPA